MEFLSWAVIVLGILVSLTLVALIIYNVVTTGYVCGSSYYHPVLIGKADMHQERVKAGLREGAWHAVDDTGFIALLGDLDIPEDVSQSVVTAVDYFGEIEVKNFRAMDDSWGGHWNLTVRKDKGGGSETRWSYEAYYLQIEAKRYWLWTSTAW